MPFDANTSVFDVRAVADAIVCADDDNSDDDAGCGGGGGIGCCHHSLINGCRGCDNDNDFDFRSDSAAFNDDNENDDDDDGEDAICSEHTADTITNALLNNHHSDTIDKIFILPTILQFDGTMMSIFI